MTRSPLGLGAFLALVLFTAGASPAGGQSLTLGSLRGTVTTVAREPLFDVFVTASSPASGLRHGTRTDRLGHFEIELIAAGEYELSVEHLGYRPLRIGGVQVRPGHTVVLTPRLASVAGPELGDAATGAVASGAAHRAPDPSRHLDRELLAAFPWIHQAAGGYAGLSSRLESGGMGGFARSDVARVHLDGFFGASRLADLLPPAWMPGPLPAGAVRSVQIIPDPFDAEWPDGRGAVIHLLSSPGTERWNLHGSGSMAVPVEGFESVDGAPSGADRASVALRGPAGSSGRFAVAGEAFRVAQPIFDPPAGSPAARALQLAAAGIAQEIGAASGAATLVSAHARYDGAISDGHQLSAHLRVAAAMGVRELDPTGFVRLLDPGSDRAEVDVGAALTSEVLRGVHQELRLGFLSDRYDGGAGTAGERVIPRTRIDALGLDFGSGPVALVEGSERTVTLQQALHARAGEHRFKAGIFGNVSQLRLDYPGTATREFLFADLAAFELRDGWYREATAASSASDFTLLRAGAFLQTTWALAPGLDVEVGGRLEVERVPWLDIPIDTARLQTLGLARADSAAALLTRLSPRASVAWRPGSNWLILARAGLFHDPVEARLAAEIDRFAFGGIGRVGAATFGDWPGSPGDRLIPSAGVGSLLLPLDYATPREVRADLALVRALARGTVVRLGLFASRGALLPRRHDLNLLDEPWGADQHGRPIYLGSAAGVPSFLPAISGRRFAGFGPVLAIDGDGTSELEGVTVAVEHTPAAPLKLLLSFTLSRFRDDAPSDGRPLPPGLLWGDGPGDHDVPRRGLVIAEWAPALPLRPALSVAYRYDSGLPFTPLVRGAVDVNGDGDPANDPAFIDPEIPGTQALLDAWPCLARQPRSFAGRNSCRGRDVQALSIGFRLRSVPLGGFAAELAAELLDLLPDRRELLDPALYLIPSGSPVEYGVADGLVVFPYVVNPGFGEPLVDRPHRPTLRLGVSLRS